MVDVNAESGKMAKELADKTGISLDDDTQKAIKEIVTPLITSMGAMAITAAAVAVISKLVVTNVKESDLTGDRKVKPTEQETTVSKSEAAASETEGKLSKDGVSAQDGNIKAAETEAKASTGEATAAESGAQAVRTKAGASDIEVKALKMT